MAFTPFTPQDDDITKPGQLISFEAFGALANNINLLMDSMPPGSIIGICTEIPGCPVPDPTIWQECDGSLIDNQNSPLRNSNTPDYGASGGLYMRGFTTAGEIGNLGGSNTKDLIHSHTGSTSVNSDEGDNSEESKDRYTVFPHTHPIAADLTDTNFEPVYIKIRHFMKIR